MNIFEQTSKKKIRFSSNRGDLTAEQLWDMPLQSKSGFDLDTIAKEVNRGIKESSEESFVTTKSSSATTTLELQLEVLKHIIAVKIEAAAVAAKRTENEARRAKLIEALENKQNSELNNMSSEDILKELEKLS
jgi:hypothetical protein